MLADDDAHIEKLKIILLSLLPLAPLALLVVCRLGLLISGKGESWATPAEGRGTGIDNNLEQPLVLGVAPNSPSVAESPKSFGEVSHLERTPLSVWRQSAAAGLLLISLGSFVGLQVGCYLFKDGSDIVPRNETMGLLGVALSALGAMQFYRREVKKPAHVIESRAAAASQLCGSYVLRARAMLCFWLCVLGVQVYRIYTTIQIYRSDWEFMSKRFCVLLLIADIACALLAVPSIALFLQAERLREDIRGVLHSVYGPDCFPHIMPPTTKDPSPEGRAGLLQLLTFVWIQKVLRKGRKELLTHDDLYAMKEDERASIVFARLQKVWSDKSKGMSTETSYSLYAVIWDFLNPTFLFATALKILNDSLSMLDVLLLNLLVKHMTSDEPHSTGFVLCALLALNAYSETFFLNQYFHRMFVCGVRLRSCLATAVYLKALRVDQSQLTAEGTPDGESEFTSGKIINLMSTDAQRVGDVMSFIQILWSAPFQIALCSVMLYKQLGLASLGGIGVMILGIPVTALLTAKTRKLQKTMMELKDERLKCTSELIQGIRAIKIYSWELPFMRLIDGIRLNELDALKRSQITNSYSRFMINAIPIAVALVSFSIFITVQKNTLTPAIAFTSLALFDSLRFPLFSLPNVIMAASEASVTVRRLQLFMNLPELKTAHLTDPSNPAGEPVPINPADRVAISCKGLDIGFNASADAAVAAVAPPASEKEGTAEGDVESREGLSSQQTERRDLLLKNLNMTLRLGEYIAVVGRTGCGKSVLFNTILRELDSVMAGEMSLKGTVALCTQSAWIRSGSVRENILFGKPYVESWYQKVVDACALRPDFKVLTDGDFTEIGERGVNLSGGQKQRIALARAVYFDAEVYILDDILSAVDSHVATHIYQHVIRGLLRQKAVLLATHRFECLDGADRIYMLRRGRSPVVFDSVAAARRNREFGALADEGEQQAGAEVEEIPSPGTPARNSDSIVPSGSSPAARSSSRAPRPSASLSGSLEMSQCLSKEIDLDLTEQQQLNDLDAEDEADQEQHAESKALVAQEAMQEGRVSGKVYLSYVRAGGGWLTIVTLMVFLCSTAAAGLGASFWLSHWSDHSGSIEPVHGLLSYGAIQCSGLVLLILALTMLIVVTQKAARFYHGRMLFRIIHARMRFFESTPIGRLTNKFSKDLYTIDELLPMTLYQFLNMLVQVLATLVAVSVILPIMLVIIAPVLVVYYWTERLYVAVARQFKRLDSVSRSPLFTHFAESLDGARTIRAMRQKGQFLGLHLKYLDENMSAAYIYIVSNRWLSVRLESLGNLIVSAVAIFCVVLRRQLSGGNAGLALSYAIRVTAFLNWLVRMSGDRESNIVAVERVIEYNDDENCPQEDYVRKMALPEEAAPLVRTNSKRRVRQSGSFGEEPANANLPPMQLGTVGEVELVNVSLRYRPELPFALKSVSFKIARGEKVGIVGRTGAGKSSLLVCLLRLVELTEGSIIVHGVDSLSYSVDQLREQISIIPQDSVIFSGTLRRNLDPFERASESDLWAALTKACLRDFVESLPGGLDYPISENGGNISVGQRQLLCLARVLLKQASVLLLDEATSAVDPQTDAQIQKCLREEFNQTTIITIAHRLKTVIDYDRIIVMANGGILEQGPPNQLLADPQSEFSQMYLSM